MEIFINEGQKLLLQTTTQALENCSFPFLFDSRALITTLRHIASTTRTAMPCAPRSFMPSCIHALCTTFIVHHVHRSRSSTRTPPNSSAALALAVLLQLHDRDFSSRVAKERLSNSFAFDSFVRKQTRWERAKKKTVDYRIRIPAIG